MWRQNLLVSLGIGPLVGIERSGRDPAPEPSRLSLCWELWQFFAPVLVLAALSRGAFDLLLLPIRVACWLTRTLEATTPPRCFSCFPCIGSSCRTGTLIHSSRRRPFVMTMLTEPTPRAKFILEAGFSETCIWTFAVLLLLSSKPFSTLRRALSWTTRIPGSERAGKARQQCHVYICCGANF